MNLPYSAESDETGTAGKTVSVVLRERLNSSSVYYYTVSAVGDVFVKVLAESFTTPEYSKWWHGIPSGQHNTYNYIKISLDSDVRDVRTSVMP